MRQHTNQNDAHSILPLPDKTFNNARACMNGSTPSTGLVTVQLALRVCATPVHLYGFYPHCCYDQGWARPWWRGLNYKYFHTNSSRWVCCAGGREDMENELLYYGRMEAKGLVKVHLPKPPHRIGNDSSVGYAFPAASRAARKGPVARAGRKRQQKAREEAAAAASTAASAAAPPQAAPAAAAAGPAECVDTDACDTCAVVGSSDRLRLNGKHGAPIDGHQCVFRVNHAPTRGYEDYVGRKTTHRVIGDGTMRLLLGDYTVASNRRGGKEAATCQGCESLHGSAPSDARSICRADSGEACIYALKKADRARYEAGGRRIFLRLSEQRLALNLTSRLCSARPAFERAAMRVKAESGRGVRSGSDEYRRLALSGGFLTLLMARELCNKAQRIDVFGMETNATDDCCRDMNRRYSYYQPQSHHKCCIRSRETRDQHEIAAWEHFQRSGEVALH